MIATNYNFIKKVRKIKTYSSDFFFSSLSTIVYIISIIIAAPIYIKYLGEESYGLIVLFMSIAGAGNMFDFGISQTLIRYIPYYSKTKQRQFLLNSTLTITLLTCLLILSFFVIFNQNITKLIFTTTESTAWNYSAILMTFVIGICGFIINNYFFSVFKGLAKFKTQGINEAAFRMTSVGISLLLTINGFSVVAILTWQAVFSLFFNFILFFQLSFLNKLSWKVSFDFRFFKKYLLSFTSWIWVQNLISFVYGNIDKFLIGILLGLKELAIYSLAFQASRVFLIIIFKGFGFLMPYVAKQKENIDFAKNAYKKVTFLTSVIGAVLATVFSVFLAKPVLFLWLEPETAQKVILPFSLLVWNSAFMLTSVVNAYILNGAGKVKLVTSVGVCGNLIEIMLVVLLGSIFGLTGVILARLFASSFCITLARSISYNIAFDSKEKFVGLKNMYVLWISFLICFICILSTQN